MSSQDPTRPQSAPPGWYWTDEGQRRYWDGQAWSRQVAPAYVESPPLPPPQPRRRWRRPRLGRAGSGILVIGAFLVITALVRGQGLKSFDFTNGKAEFYSPAASHDLSTKTIKNGQPAIQSQLRTLQGQAESQSAAPSATSEKLNGTWRAAGDFRYDIQQYGSQAVIEESSPDGVTAIGAGTVHGADFAFQFQAVNGATGTGELSLVDSKTLKGTFTGDDGVVEAAVLHR